MSNFRWLSGRSPRQVFGRRREILVRRIGQSVYMLLIWFAPQIEADMKRNATWEDQTGNARQTLAAFVFFPETGVVALVGKQQMDYGKWLELKNGGRYAIVGPTMEMYYETVWDAAQELVE